MSSSLCFAMYMHLFLLIFTEPDGWGGCYYYPRCTDQNTVTKLLSNFPRFTGKPGLKHKLTAIKALSPHPKWHTSPRCQKIISKGQYRYENRYETSRNHRWDKGETNSKVKDLNLNHIDNYIKCKQSQQPNYEAEFVELDKTKEDLTIY